MSIIDPNWTPLRASGTGVTNSHFISGFFSPNGIDTNFAFTQQEFSLLSAQVPAAQVTPLLADRSVIMGPATLLATIAQNELNSPITEAQGGCLTTILHRPSTIFVETVPTGSSSTAIGDLMHEWGHAVDIQHQYQYAAPGFQFTINNATINAAWTRIQTIEPGAAFGNASYLYGYTNIREYWAELYRFHYLGSHGAGSANNGWTDGLGGHSLLTADQMFRALISGTSGSNEAGPDDASTVAMHTFIPTVAPPYPTLVIPS